MKLRTIKIRLKDTNYDFEFDRKMYRHLQKVSAELGETPEEYINKIYEGSYLQSVEKLRKEFEDLRSEIIKELMPHIDKVEKLLSTRWLRFKWKIKKLFSWLRRAR